jgi:FAD/FMN-containing dehydrogenase
VDDDASQVAFDTEPGYQSANVHPYNINWPVTPVAVTYPQTAEQVASIVQCAAEGGYKVQARSGGHSYGNYCVSPRDAPNPP